MTFHHLRRGIRPGRNGLALALAPLALAAGGASAQSLVTFDSFDSTTISPSRWSGDEGRSNGTTRVESRRAIVSNQLRLEAKGYGHNTGTSGSGLTRNSVVFAKSSAITTIRATVTMRTASVGSCPGNTTPTTARARLFGFFFNAGTPQPGSNFNDVIAGIGLQRASNSSDATGVLRVSAFVAQCNDDVCNSSTTLGSKDMGTVNLGTPVALQIGWNASGNQFTFQRDTQAVVTLPYGVPDTLPPSVPTKRLEVSNLLARCAGTRVAATSAADFDNVQTNPLPSSAAALDGYAVEGDGEAPVGESS